MSALQCDDMPGAGNEVHRYLVAQPTTDCHDPHYLAFRELMILYLGCCIVALLHAFGELMLHRKRVLQVRPRQSAVSLPTYACCSPVKSTYA